MTLYLVVERDTPRGVDTRRAQRSTLIYVCHGVLRGRESTAVVHGSSIAGAIHVVSVVPHRSFVRTHVQGKRVRSAGSVCAVSYVNIHRKCNEGSCVREDRIGLRVGVSITSKTMSRDVPEETSPNATREFTALRAEPSAPTV